MRYRKRPQELEESIFKRRLRLTEVVMQKGSKEQRDKVLLSLKRALAVALKSEGFETVCKPDEFNKEWEKI